MPQVASLAARWLLRLVVCFGLWMLLIDNVAQPEVVTGIVCAVLAATLATVAIGTRHVGFRLRPGLLRHAWRPLLELFSDSGKLTVALARQLVLRRRVRGRFRAARHRATAGTPEAAARVTGLAGAQPLRHRGRPRGPAGPGARAGPRRRAARPHGAGMTKWLAAAIALAAALLPLAAVCVRGSALEGLVALEAAGVIASLALVVPSEAFNRQPFIDLAIVLVAMSFAGSLGYLRYFERRRRE